MAGRSDARIRNRQIGGRRKGGPTPAALSSEGEARAGFEVALGNCHAAESFIATTPEDAYQAVREPGPDLNSLANWNCQ
jgi:hypothetical protein